LDSSGSRISSHADGPAENVKGDRVPGGGPHPGRRQCLPDSGLLGGPHVPCPVSGTTITHVPIGSVNQPTDSALAEHSRNPRLQFRKTPCAGSTASLPKCRQH
jgi:hypothetical protein